MNVNTLQTFALMAFLLSITPGPNTGLVVKNIYRFDVKATLWGLCGICSAFLIHGALSALGFSALVLNSAIAFTCVKFLGAFYLIYVGLKTLWGLKNNDNLQMEKSYSNSSKSRTRLFVEGFLTNLLNPKVSLFYLSAFPQFINPQGHLFWESIFLVLTHVCITFSWYCFLIFILTKFAKTNFLNKTRKGVEAITGGVFVGFGLHLLTKEATP